MACQMCCIIITVTPFMSTMYATPVCFVLLILISSCYTKAGPDLELPPCKHEDRWLDLSKVERAVYQAKKKDMDAAVQLYIQSRSSAETNIR